MRSKIYSRITFNINRIYWRLLSVAGN